MKKAACLLFPDMQHDGTWLVVSRRNSPDMWGLPGGKVDPGENPMQAVIRETFEEVGLTVNESDLKEIHTSVCVGEVSYEVTTFLYTKQVTLDHIMSLDPESGLTFGWTNKDVLCDANQSPFAEYNKRMFNDLEKNNE